MRRIPVVAIAGWLLLAACGSPASETPIDSSTTAGTATSTVVSTTTAVPTTTTTATTTTTPASTSTTEPSTTTTMAPGPVETVEIPAYVFWGPDGLFRVEGGEQTRVSGEQDVFGVARDGMGGFVWATRGEETTVLWWLQAGTIEPRRLGEGVISGAPGVVDGQPIVLITRYAPEQCPEADGYYWGDGYFALYLPSGEEAFLFCDRDGPDGGIRPDSLGNGMVLGVAWTCWEPCSSHQIVFWDLTGSPLDVPTNPFPESCAPCELGAMLSPNGELLAYRYWPEAYWPDERTLTLSEEEWWNQARDIPADLVVLDLTTGEERFRTTVPAWTRLADFDGRFLVVEPIPDRAPDAETTIIDSFQEHAPVNLTGHVRILTAVQP